MRIDVALTTNLIFGVDTQEHLEKARALLKSRATEKS
jgi:CMP-2-keto-3-deoxyoctulosonic acid synthetase